VILLAIAGNLLSADDPARWPAGAPDLKVHWNPIPESLAILRLAKKQLAVRNASWA
jgi:hypothetical protein